jgi:hypothetical protein
MGLSAGDLRAVRRVRLNARKKALTAVSSARWANAIIAGNDDQVRLARDAQYRHIVGLRAAIATMAKRLAAPSAETLTAAERKARRKARGPKGYASQAERFQKQRRLQHLRGELARVEADRSVHRVRVVEGGKRLARTRHHLDEAGITVDQWRDRWDAARWRITAKGSPDEPFGNLTITVTPAGEISVRLPKPLEHFSNAPRGRYILAGRAVFANRGEEWAQRITSGNSVYYALTRKPGRAGRYLTASWAIPSVPYWGRPRRLRGRRLCVGPGGGRRSQRRAYRRASSRRPRQPHRAGGTRRHRPHRLVTTPRRPSPPRHHTTDPLRGPAPHHSDCGRGPRLRRRPYDRSGNHGSRETGKTLPPHRDIRDPHRSVP